MVTLEVSQIWYLQDYALTSWLVNQENLTVKFSGLLNQFGIVQQEYKTRTIKDLIMKSSESIFMWWSCILRRKLSELMAILFQKMAKLLPKEMEPIFQNVDISSLLFSHLFYLFCFLPFVISLGFWKGIEWNAYIFSAMLNQMSLCIIYFYSARHLFDRLLW